MADALRARRRAPTSIPFLNVEDLDLDNRRAPIRSKGGGTEWIYWGTATAHLLPRLLRLPDGSSRTSGPLLLPSRRLVPARRPGRTTSAPNRAAPSRGHPRRRSRLPGVLEAEVLIAAGFPELDIPTPWWGGRGLRFGFPPR